MCSHKYVFSNRDVGPPNGSVKPPAITSIDLERDQSSKSYTVLIISNYMYGIVADSLLKTFQDTIYVTRNLGIRYL